MRHWGVGIGLVLGLSSVISSSAFGAGPVDELFRLVPPDAGVTLVAEDLRGLAREFFDSPLADGLQRLPAVRAWLESGKLQGLRHAQGQIEKTLGEPIAAIRDDLFGDAVVLAMHLPADRGPDQVHGLLLTRVRKRALLDRAIKELNEAQTRKGELARVVERSWHGSPYSVREYQGGKKPADYFATLDGGTFAWTNSEELVRGAIDRAAGGSRSLADVAKFQGVRRRLPGRAAVSLFVDPRFLERILAASPRSSKPEEERVQALFGRYLGAVEYAGAALEWRGGFVLHAEETLDPGKLDPWIKKWAARSEKRDPSFPRVPATALAVATMSVDVGAIAEGIGALVPDAGRAKLANGLDVLRGILLGHDLGTAVAPHLGPAVLAYMDAPRNGESKPGPPWVLAIQVSDSGVAVALDNALRTLLALYALDEKHGLAQHRVAVREIEGTKVTALDASSTPFAYAVDRGRLVIGATPESVARSFSAAADSRLERFRKAHFPGAESFACADLVALHAFADIHRTALVKKLAADHHRSEEAEGRDLDQVLALMDLFEGAYLTSALAPDATAVHRALGLVAKSTAPPPRP